MNQLSLMIIVLFHICMYSDYTLANGIPDRNEIENFDDDLFFPSEELELTRRGVWSRLFRNEINAPQKYPTRLYKSPPMALNFAMKNGRVPVLPYDKRTIPIELRKALYAHGIVGRRR